MKFKRRILLKFGAAYTFNSLLNNPLYAHNVKNLTKSPKVKIALLGLGDYAENWIAPAIAQSEYAELTSLQLDLLTKFQNGKKDTKSKMKIFIIMKIWIISLKIILLIAFISLLRLEHIQILQFGVSELESM